MGSVGLGPDADSGEQKACDGSREKAEQHFVLMPEQGGQSQWQLNHTGDFQNPKRDGNNGQYRHGQEKNPERIGKELAEAGRRPFRGSRYGLHRCLPYTCILSIC